MIENQLENFSTGVEPIPFWRTNLFRVLTLLFLFILFYFFLFSAPWSFPKESIFRVTEGDSLSKVARNLKQAHFIRSEVAFKTLVILYGGEKHLITADYFFEDNLSVYEMARRISRGDRHLEPLRVTIPEGSNISEIATIFKSKLLNFNEANFLLTAKGKEGYLFPDTYFFFTTDDEETAIFSMEHNFEKKITPLTAEILKSGHSEKEIITMASIIEREAKGDADRNIISGILWKRFSIGMPLQADAAPETYEAKGLPKNPISNPGILAIKAALNPEKSSYLYYLHDKDGNIHYAHNFEEHKANKLKYLP